MRTFFDHLAPQRLQELIDRFSTVSIAVLGDYFLDKYLDVDPTLAESSVETGKTAHQVVRQRHSPGAAGTIVCNLAALGAGNIRTLGFTGDDGASYELRNDLADLGCDLSGLHIARERITPTYLKPRDNCVPGLAGEHSRYDTKNRTPTPDELQQRIIASLDAILPDLSAVIILDQLDELDCGVVTTHVRNALADRAAHHQNTVFWADSRCRIREFRCVTIKANQFEVVGQRNPLPGDTVDLGDLMQASTSLRAEAGAPVFVTRGCEGMLVRDHDTTLVPGIHIDGPIDETGAGDSATAGAVLALAAGAELPEAALVGNLVASITIEQLATTGTASPEQLPPRLEMWQRQVRR